MNTSGQTVFSNTAASLIMQGWNGTTWDTLMPPFNPSTAPNTVSGTFQTFTFTQNLTIAYSKFRLQGIAGTVTALLMKEIKILAPANYTPSANPKSTCAVDNDNDGILNHLDLDSDGDGCPDALESGTSNHSNITTTSGIIQNGSGGTVTSSVTINKAVIQGPYGSNGFADGLQAVGNANTYDSTYAYSNATDSSVHTCCPQISNNTIGSNQSFCGNSQPNTLTGSVPTFIPATTPVYEWLSSTTSSTGGFTVVAEQSSSSYSPGVLIQTTWYKRVVYANGCTSSADTTATVAITINAKPDAGPDQNVCGNTVTMAGIGTGTWTQQGTTPAVANINTPSSNSTPITGLTIAGTYHFVWTLNGCADTVSITVQPKPNAGIDQVICAGDTVNMNAVGTGLWSQIGTTPATAIITTPSSNTTTVNSLAAAGIYNFMWTLNGCTDTMTVTANAIPAGSLTGSTFCEGGTGQLTFTNSSGLSAFTIVINGVTYSNIQSGIPFAPNPMPTITTNYNLTKITDSNGCVNDPPGF